MALIKLDFAGIGAILKGAEVRAAIDAYGEEIAGNIRSSGLVASDGPLPVEVSSYTTDRAASAVTITHPAGLPMQAKHGVLTQAAGSAGLEVKER